MISLAIAAVENDFVMPTLVEDKVLIIEDGRHPLVERCCETFVPNSSKIDSEDGYVHIITGPNNSGKSVYMKQVGIIAYLAHICSFVPAKSATIGFIDKIFSRIDTSSSSISNLSTFARDASQASRMLNKCSERSLLLIDEFGKGTYALDGCALLSSIIVNLDDRLSNRCPRAFISTHFHEMFTTKIVQETKIVKFQQIKIIKEQISSAKNSSDKLEELVFLYQLAPGLCLHSYGLYCASKFNVPEKVSMQSICNCIVQL